MSRCDDFVTTTATVAQTAAVGKEKFGANSIWRRMSLTQLSVYETDWDRTDSNETADSDDRPSLLLSPPEQQEERFGANSIWRRSASRQSLDKNHGFMKLIVRNQLDRSNNFFFRVQPIKFCRGLGPRTTNSCAETGAPRLSTTTTSPAECPSTADG